MKKKLKLIFVSILFVFLVGGTYYYILYKKSEKTLKLEESKISISLINKTIKAETGSYCYSNYCVDKTGPTEFNYQDKLIGVPGEQIKIFNNDNKIKDILIYDLSKKEKLNKSLIFDDNSLTIPKLNGNFAIEIKTSLNNKSISYYFKLKINEVNDKYQQMVTDLKNNLITKGYLNENLKDFRLIRFCEYGYYPKDLNTKYVQADLYITCKEKTTCTNNLTKIDLTDESNKALKDAGINYSGFVLIYKKSEFKEIKKLSFNSTLKQTGIMMLDVSE
jgi:hypothetical protein